MLYGCGSGCWGGQSNITTCKSLFTGGCVGVAICVADDGTAATGDTTAAEPAPLPPPLPDEEEEAAPAVETAVKAVEPATAALLLLLVTVVEAGSEDALAMVRPGGTLVGIAATGGSNSGGGGGTVVETIKTAGIDLRFSCRHGFRAAFRRSVNERVRRAFLQNYQYTTISIE